MKLARILAITVAFTISGSASLYACPNKYSDAGHFTYGGYSNTQRTWVIMDRTFKANSGVTVFYIEKHERELLLAWTAMLTNPNFAYGGSIDSSHPTNWCAVRDALQQDLMLTYGTLDRIHDAAANAQNGSPGVQTAFQGLLGGGVIYSVNGGQCPKDISVLSRSNSSTTDPTMPDPNQPKPGDPIINVEQYMAKMKALSRR
jgi:hypothetical protein